jgi:hypothetical protein
MVDAKRTRFLDSRSAFHACVAFAARLKVIVPGQSLYRLEDDHSPWGICPCKESCFRRAVRLYQEVDTGRSAP